MGRFPGVLPCKTHTSGKKRRSHHFSIAEQRLFVLKQRLSSPVCVPTCDSLLLQQREVIENIQHWKK
jgi:hypothetical protein